MTGPLITVALGTDHHRFDRLLAWVHRIAVQQPGWTWHVQHGATPLPPPLVGSQQLDQEELIGLMARSDAVICHAGPGLIMDARAAGHVPVVVPRIPELSEIVDHHQLAFAKFAADKGLIRTVTEQSALLPALTCALASDRTNAGVSVASLAAAEKLEHLVKDLLTSRQAPKTRRRRGQ